MNIEQKRHQIKLMKQNEEKEIKKQDEKQLRRREEKEMGSVQNGVGYRLSRSSSKVIQNGATSLDLINSTQKELHSLINQLDQKLKENYYLKQQKLIKSYRQELIKAHKDLIDLKNKTNQKQIKNQMNEKALQLKKQRLELIQTNMFYSNKCLQYKKILDQRISQSNELQRQIQFLQRQINSSNKKKLGLMAQVYQQNSPLKINQLNSHNKIQSTQFNQQLEVNKSTKKYKILMNTPQKLLNLKKDSLQNQNDFKSPLTQNTTQKILSTLPNTQCIKKESISSKGKMRSNSRMGNKQINSQIKRIFEDKLAGPGDQLIKNSKVSRKNGQFLSKLSTLNGFGGQTSKQETYNQKKGQIQKGSSQIQNLFMKIVDQMKERRLIKKQVALIKGEQFSKIEKKQIMKIFLSKQQVKQYIYNVIFDKVQSSTIFRKRTQKQKIKIFASQNQAQKHQ